MAEICRAQIWQWRHHEVELTNGVTVDDALLDRLFAEERTVLRADLGEVAWAAGRFDEAADMLREWSSRDDLIGFFPIEASPAI